MKTQSILSESVSKKKLVVQLQYKEINQIIQDISGVFPYVIIKGIPLSIMSYNDCYKRKIGDVDFLISKEHIVLFDEILKKNSFSSEYYDREDKLIALLYSHQTRPYVKNTPIHKTYIDVNYDIFWGEYSGKRIDIKDFISQPLTLDVLGYQINTLTPLKMLIVLILHHYKEMNSLYHLATHNTIRKDMFFDVYNIIRNNSSSITANSLARLCEVYEITQFAYYILYYTYKLFPDSEILKFVEVLYNDEGKRLLPCYGLSDNERREWKCDFATRVNEMDIKSLIYEQLTQNDINKIERNKLIFGE